MHGLCQKILSTISFQYHPNNIQAFDNKESSDQIQHISNPETLDSKGNQLVQRHGQIKLLTLNLFMRPPLIKTNSSDFKEARLQEFIKCLPDYDIMCLQEVFTTFNTRKQRLISYAMKAGFQYHAQSEEPSLFSSFVTDGGLLILSRFPILEVEFRPFDYGVLADAISYKGVLYAKIEVEGRILHLFTTHTQATYFGVHVDNFVSDWFLNLDFS